MKKIALIGKYGIGKFALVDDDDFERLNKHRWHCDNYGYVRTAIIGGGDKCRIRMHRMIMNPPSKMEVDHIDHIVLNNQKSNLRICTHSQNQKNLKMTIQSRSGFKGVYRVKNKNGWQSAITYNGKKIRLGTYKNKIAAAKAYNKAAKKYHGEFAILNKITVH